MAQGHDAIPNLLGMARTAVEAGNNEEAISYFNRVLEIDPTVSEAWLGKGAAVGWLSSLQNPRLKETVVAFGHAIGSAPDDQRPTIASQAMVDLTRICDAVYGMAYRHWQEFPTVDSAWDSYVRISASVLDTLESGDQWCPHYRPALDLTVTICRDGLNEGMTPSYEEFLRGRLEKTFQVLETIDPDYVRVEPAEESQATKRAKAIESQQTSDALGMVVLAIVVIVAIFIALTR